MPEPLAIKFKTGVNLMKNFNDEPQESQSEQNRAERQNPPQFDNKPLIVKDYNIVVFFIYNLIFAPLAALVFLYIGDIFPYYTPFVFVAFAVISYLNKRPYALCSFDE
ncbi:MAG: hypothetical protein ACLVCW_04395 [Campylobacter sp.]